MANSMLNAKFLPILLAFAFVQMTAATSLTREDIHSLFDSFDTSIVRDDEYVIAGFSQRRLFIPNASPEPSVKETGRPAEFLLRKLKRDPYEYGFDRRGRLLSQRGKKAEKELIEALRNAKDYYRICLIHILGATATPQRDAAFLAQLERMVAEEKDFLLDDAAEPLMQTLAAGGVKDAIPVLERFLRRKDIHDSTRAEARVALVQLGALDLAAMAAPSITIAPEAAGEAYLPHMTFLEALMKYGLLQLPQQVTGAEVIPGGYTLLNGTLEEGTWYVKFGPEVSGRIPFYYTYYEGPLNAAGYFGVFAKLDEEWIVTFWRMAWVS